MYNRFYTDQESSCINHQQGAAPPDYLPIVFGSSLHNYESDTYVVGNWADDLGIVAPIPKNWYLLWDHIVSPGSPAYIGYYAAQSDLVANGELGNPRADPCTTSATPPSCMAIVKAALADNCPQTQTPLGTIQNLGGLAPVPVPLLRSLLADTNTGFADPAGRIALDWLAACAWTQNEDTVFSNGFAPVPVMGYRVEVFADRTIDGVLESPTSAGWDPANRAVNGGCESGAFVPLVDIAPLAGDIVGSQMTHSTVIDIAPHTAAGGALENPALIEALTFRLRVLFQDDRFEAPSGGKDFVIDPVCSAPSAMGFAVPNPGIFGAPAGAVPDGAGVAGLPLTVSEEPNGDVTLTWGASCNAGDSDYVVYEGVLGDFGSHAPRFCSTAGATNITFTANSDNAYFVVAPRNTDVLGSFGQGSDGSERPEGLSPCAGQSFSCGGGLPVLPPDAVTDPASSVSYESATLNGTINPNDFDTDAWFEWGTTTALGSATPAVFVGNGTSPALLTFNLAGIADGTTFFFRTAAMSPVGLATGPTLSFSTAPILPPVVVTDPATAILQKSAVLNTTITPNGADTSVHFDWGLDTSYGNTTSSLDVGAGASPVSAPIPLTGLTPNTPYHYRAVATNSQGTTNGSDAMFSTFPIAAPGATTLPPTYNFVHAQWSIVFQGQVNPRGDPTTYRFEWGATPAYGSMTPGFGDPELLAGDGDQFIDVIAGGGFGLWDPGTTWNVRIVATNSLGTMFGSNVQFTVPPLPP